MRLEEANEEVEIEEREEGGGRGTSNPSLTYPPQPKTPWAKKNCAYFLLKMGGEGEGKGGYNLDASGHWCVQTPTLTNQSSSSPPTQKKDPPPKNLCRFFLGGGGKRAKNS